MDLGDPTAMRLCLERILPRCRERSVEFALPSIESAADIAPAMKAVTSALAKGEITPGEAATIAAVVDTFVRAVETSDFERRLKEAEDSLSRNSEAAAGWRPIGGGTGHSTTRRDFAADPLQVQQRANSRQN